MGAAPLHELLTLLKLRVMYTNNSHEDSSINNSEGGLAINYTHFHPECSRELDYQQHNRPTPCRAERWWGWVGDWHFQRAFFWNVRWSQETVRGNNNNKSNNNSRVLSGPRGDDQSSENEKGKIGTSKNPYFCGAKTTRQGLFWHRHRGGTISDETTALCLYPTTHNCLMSSWLDWRLLLEYFYIDY